jgi:beta-lactamase regulating signal transducer with metallopeptidase domain
VSLAGALGAYASLNAALVVAGLGLAALSATRRFGPRALLSLNYFVFAALVASLMANAMLPEASFIQPSARIWSAEELPQHAATPAAPTTGWLSVGDTGFDAGSVGRVWIATALTLLALGLIALGRDLARLHAIHRHSHRVRRIGRVSVWINDAVATPFSYWRPGRAHVVLPAYLVEHPAQLRMVLAHELQHHRQRDTVWLHAFRALRLVCFANPFAYLWARQVARLQEFACDEAVTARPAWPVERYARCLLDVATRGAKQVGTPPAAVAFIGFGDPKFLIRRIETMMNSQPIRRGGRHLAIVACFAAAMTTAAFAAGNQIQDRRVTAEQAQQMLARMPSSPEFRIVINDEVLAELNRYAGTAEGREFMRAALEEQKVHAVTVATALSKHGVPAELAAVPIVESGYRNLDQSKNKVKGAGIWQFIPNTARAYGLRVDGEVDDRLNPVTLSDAAGRMLQADRQRLGDWQLALLAFNAGHGAVQKSIDSTGSRNAWTLVRAGIGGDRAYLARVHAAVIIAANPEMVAK